MHRLILAAASLAAILFFSTGPALAQTRVALVIANSAYQSAPPLKTTASDAGLIAATLKAAGYDVVEADNVTNANIGAVIGAFRDKIAAGGANTVAFLYFAGYGAQLNGDDYLLPVDVKIDKAADLPNKVLPLSAVISALGAVPAAARIIVLDASRDGGFGKTGGQPVPPGLALIGVPPGFLLAYSAAPGALASDGDGPDSPFASALATLMRQPGLTIEQVLDGVRLQVNQASGGAQTPWMGSALNVEVKFFSAPAAAAPTTLAPALGVAGLAVPPASPRRLTKARMRKLPPAAAYQAAIEADSLRDYQWFVEQFPHYQLTGQVWDIINRRRESILWNRARTVGTTQAYWNYLDRYRNGIHADEAHDWLAARYEPSYPPSDYVPEPLDLPPDYEDEAVGLSDLVQDGFPPPPDVWGDVAPIFVPAPPFWQRPTRIIIVQPVAPAPLPANNNLPPLTPKPPNLQPAQPVQPIVNPTETPEQKQEKARAIQAWQDRVREKNEKFGQKYHLPPVAPANAPNVSGPSAPAPAARSVTPVVPAAPGQSLVQPSGPASHSPAPTHQSTAPVIPGAPAHQVQKPVVAAPTVAPPQVPYMTFQSQSPGAAKGTLPANAGAAKALDAIDADKAGGGPGGKGKRAGPPVIPPTPATKRQKPGGFTAPPAIAAPKIPPATIHPVQRSGASQPTGGSGGELDDAVGAYKPAGENPRGGKPPTKRGEAPVIPPVTPKHPQSPAVRPNTPAIPGAPPKHIEHPIVPAPTVHPEAPLVPRAAPQHIEHPLVPPPTVHPQAPLVPRAGPQHIERPMVPVPTVHPTAPLVPRAAPQHIEHPIVPAPVVHPQAPLVPRAAPQHIERPMVPAPVVHPQAPLVPRAAPRHIERPIVPAPTTKPGRPNVAPERGQIRNEPVHPLMPQQRSSQQQELRQQELRQQELRQRLEQEKQPQHPRASQQRQNLEQRPPHPIPEQRPQQRPVPEKTLQQRQIQERHPQQRQIPQRPVQQREAPERRMQQQSQQRQPQRGQLQERSMQQSQQRQMQERQMQQRRMQERQTQERQTQQRQTQQRQMQQRQMQGRQMQQRQMQERQMQQRQMQQSQQRQMQQRQMQQRQSQQHQMQQQSPQRQQQRPQCPQGMRFESGRCMR